MRDYWTIPPDWHGETAFLLAGGPSLIGFDAERLRGRGKIITINDSYRLCPWADVIYFCDKSWWYKHRAEIQQVFTGGCIVTLENRQIEGMHSLRSSGKTGLETADHSAIRTGGNSGYQAIGVAAHLGAARIVLLGYDMHCRYRSFPTNCPICGAPSGDELGAPHDGLCEDCGCIINGDNGRTHWHGGHAGTSPGEYERRCAKWRKNYQTLVHPLEKMHVEVLNATPGSALKGWLHKPLTEILR